MLLNKSVIYYSFEEIPTCEQLNTRYDAIQLERVTQFCIEAKA